MIKILTSETRTNIPIRVRKRIVPIRTTRTRITCIVTIATQNHCCLICPIYNYSNKMYKNKYILYYLLSLIIVPTIFPTSAIRIDEFLWLLLSNKNLPSFLICLPVSLSKTTTIFLVSAKNLK